MDELDVSLQSRREGIRQGANELDRIALASENTVLSVQEFARFRDRDGQMEPVPNEGYRIGIDSIVFEPIHHRRECFG